MDPPSSLPRWTWYNMNVKICDGNGLQDVRFFHIPVAAVSHIIFLRSLACASKLRVFPGFPLRSRVVEIDAVAIQINEYCTTIAVVRDPVSTFRIGDADASWWHAVRYFRLTDFRSIHRRNSHFCMKSTTSTKANQRFGR